MNHLISSSLAFSYACACVLLTAPHLEAQTTSSGVVPSIGKSVNTVTDDPFYTTNHMDRPGPNGYRSSNGTPGPNYWQQRADYTIAAVLDTTQQTVRGHLTLRYTNNSPDTLQYLWMQMDQNLFRSRSKGSVLFAAGSRWGARNFDGGYQLTDVRVDGKSATYHIDDTMMRLLLDHPLRPHGGVVTITLEFAFRVPEHGSDRMGREGSLYEIAQWYPRMAVYDDVRGWNTDPYLGQGEFYLEYGDIDFTVTAPAGYTIAASGVLQNSSAVLSGQQRERLAKAATSASVVQIISASEAKATPTPGTKSWHFLAKNVRDVAWAGAPDFRWDATNWHGILCQAYYQGEKAGTGWESAAEQTQFSVKNYSETFFPYPYPQATSVAAPVGGMEYPMFVKVHYASPKDDPTSIFQTINHEHGHEWFPMIVGSNERRYAWMDEGFNTYINTFAVEKRYAGTQRALDVYPSYLQNWKKARDHGVDVPLMTAPDHIAVTAMGPVGYRKPAALLLTLRNHVVGKETFDAAFRAYIKAWAFKHPTPGDFFRMIENYAGADLSWYWRSFWYTNAVLDIGIDSVTQRVDSTEGRQAIVALRNVTGVPFPVTMRIKFASGRTEDLKLPVDLWAGGATAEAVITERDEQVVGVRLWPDSTVPDWNAANDTWGDVPAADPLHPVTD